MSHNPIRPVGMHEMVLHVADLDASRAFYEGILGLPVVTEWGEERPAIWLDMGDSVALGLWTTKAETGAIANGRGGAHVHFAMRIPQGSVDEMQAHLASKGYDTVRIEFDDGNRSLYLDDPDGNCVELMDAVTEWSGRSIPPNTTSNRTSADKVSGERTHS